MFVFKLYQNFEPILNLTLIPTCIHPLYQKTLKKHFSKSRIRPFFASSHAKYEQKCHFFMYPRLWSSASGSEGEILESLKSKNGHLSDICLCLFQDSILDWMYVRTIPIIEKEIIFIFIFDETYLKIKKISMY